VERKTLALWVHLYLIFYNYGLFCDIFHGDKLFDDVWLFFLLSLSQLDILHISVIIRRKKDIHRGTLIKITINLSNKS